MFIQVLAMGLILTGNKSLFMQVTAKGPAYLLPMLVILSACVTVAVYVITYYFVQKYRTRSSDI